MPRRGESSSQELVVTGGLKGADQPSQKEFTYFCSEHRIHRHFSMPYTPQQNGVVERNNRTILDMTPAILKNKNLPKVFWGEAVSTAVYLLNRAPIKSLEGKTPYEGWTGRQPSVEHLKVFGCIVFVKTLGKSLRKLEIEAYL